MLIPVTGIINFFFPSCCALCRKPINGSLHICKECLSGIELISGACCSCCGMVLHNVPQAENRAPHTCEMCRKKPPHFERAFSATPYNGTMKKIISLYKYKGKSFLGDDIVHIIFSTLEKFILSTEIDLVMYVPLHRKKLKERGFNQAFILAHKIGKRIGREVPVEALTRIKQTETQTHFNREDRSKNIKGSFFLRNHDLVFNKSVLLIDDVLTTGATVNECSDVLLKGGAARIYVITAARA